MDLRLKSMRLVGVIAFFISFSVGAQWFSEEMSLKDKIEFTRQLKEQFMQKPASDQRKKQYKRNNVTGSSSIATQKKDYHNIKMILDLPLKNRIQALSKYGSKGFVILSRLVFSGEEKMPVRWKALVSLARLYPEKSLPLVQKALRSPVWFLRNAGLIAMEIINPTEGVRWAGHFLNDSSLVVRTAAVNMIKKHKASQYKVQLIGKLNASDSFYKNKSLWIRHHIASALADFCEPGEEKMFISFLQDPDERLHPSAIGALEKLTGKTFRASDDEEKTRDIAREKVVKTQKQMWISWWSESRQGESSITKTFDGS